MAAEILWREFGGFMLAPAWHAIMPACRFTRKPRLVTMVIFFNYIRASYRQWRERLRRALTYKNLSIDQTNALKNLRDLVAYYIPVVQEYLCVLKERNYDQFRKFWFHLLKIMCIFKCTNYFHPMACQALHMCWLEQNEHPIGKVMQQYMEILDEERGEISFAMLRGSTVRLTDQGDINKLSNNYRLLSVVSELDREFQVDVNGER